MWRLRDDDEAADSVQGVPLLCLGPKGHFAVSESTPRSKENADSPTIQREEHSATAPTKQQQGLFILLFIMVVRNPCFYDFTCFYVSVFMCFCVSTFD